MTDLSTASERQPLLVAGVYDIAPRPRSSHDVRTNIPSSDRHDLQNVSGRPGGNVLRIIGVMQCWICSGMLVTAVGALLESLKVYYQINNSTASLIFTAWIFGYCCAAISVSTVVTKLGWRGVAVISPSCYTIATIILGFGPPYPVALASYTLGGIGFGLSDTGFNTWGSQQKRPNIVQGWFHNAYAVGSILGPVATLAVIDNHLQWYFFYRGMALLSLLAVVLLSLAFRRDAQCGNYDTKQDDIKDTDDENGRPLKLKASKLVALCCVFYFIYNGVESSLNNWIVIFMTTVRGLPQNKAALASSIFWIGVAAGRICLGPVTEYFGVGVAVFCYTLIVIFSQIMFSVSNNYVAAFVLLGVIGCFMGPIYPSTCILMVRKLPDREALIAVAAASSVGQIGATIAPTFIGFMADKFGMQHLPDVLISLTVVLIFIWVTFVRTG